PASGVTSATVTFTAPESATDCNARLFASDSYSKLSTSATVTVTGAAGPALTIPASVAPGATVSVSLTGGPGNRTDWVGFYCPSSTSDDGMRVGFKYLNNSTSAPASGVTSATVTFTAPASATNCNARLFASDSYAKLATSSTTTVTGPTPSTPVLTAPTSVAAGAPVSVSLTGGPGNATDWIGFYCPASTGDGGA